MKRRIKKSLLRYAIKNSFLKKHPQTYSNGKNKLHFSSVKNNNNGNGNSNNNGNGSNNSGNSNLPRRLPIQEQSPGNSKVPQVARFKAVEREKIVFIKVDQEVTFRLATKRKRIEPETIEPTCKRLKLGPSENHPVGQYAEPQNTKDDLLTKLFDNGYHNILENIFLGMTLREAATCRRVSSGWKRLVDFYCGAKFSTTERVLARESSRQDGTTGRLPELKQALENCPLGDFLKMINPPPRSG